MSISLFDMMDSLSTALDLINPSLSDHHKLNRRGNGLRR
jgi:hypothetical protein